MSPLRPEHRLPKPIEQLLGRLRRQIRWYVSLDGLALAVIWVAVAYWLGFALDYLPVMVGSSELPRAIRALILAGVALVLAYILVKQVVLRVAPRFGNPSLAMLLERRFPELQDALLTTVATARDSRSSDDPALHEAMFAATVELATERTAQLDSRQVFDVHPLLRHVLVACGLLGTILAFAIVASEACATWTSRWLLLSDEPWPRRAQIEVLDFPDRQRKVAEGADLTIRVRARANLPTPAPLVCTIQYRTSNGDRGRVNMSRDGDPIDEFQYYRYEGQPFQGMLEAVTFDVIGLDHRVADYQVQVVSRPSIVQVELDCELPAYLNQPPRRIPWRAGISLPIGTKIQLLARVTKPLQQVTVLNPADGQTQTISVAQGATDFAYMIDQLTATTSLQFGLLDLDDVTSEQPYRVTLNALDDLPPQLNVGLEGIGTAITPQARLPLTGEIKDDYGLKSTWFQISVPDRELEYRLEFRPTAAGTVAETLDLRRQAALPQDAWQLNPGEKVIFSANAVDDYDLSDEPHVGRSDELPLDVVTPNELLALLEARELNIKRRFEQTLSELIETRDALLKLQAELTAPADGAPTKPADSTPGDSASGDSTPGITPNEAADSTDQTLVLQRLRVQRTEQQAAKSQQEIEGVAASFTEIRDELVNNRVDTPERKDRLQQKIIDPLQVILTEPFPGWLQQLTALGQQLDSPTERVPATQLAVQQANDIILALQQVLENMLELESFNELVDIVRAIIRDQEALQQATEDERKRQTRALLDE